MTNFDNTGELNKASDLYKLLDKKSTTNGLNTLNSSVQLCSLIHPFL